jgi:tetratricopeptide (TPR) repeat protein
MNRKERRSQKARTKADLSYSDASLSSDILTAIRSAEESHASGNLNQAIDILRGALAPSRRHPLVLQLLGGFEDEKGLTASGLALVKEAVKMAPHDHRILTNYARQLLRLGKNWEAVGTLSKIRSKAKEAPNILYMLGLAHTNLDQEQPAVDALKIYLDLQPLDTNGRHLLSKVYLHFNRPKEARSLYTSMGDEFVKIPVFHHHYAWLLGQLGEYRDATAICKDAETEFPEYLDEFKNLAAQLLGQNGQTGPAIEIIDELLSRHPGDETLMAQKASLKLTKGDLMAGGEEFKNLSRGSDNLSKLKIPVWEFQQLKDDTLLVRGEQGIGEQVMFASLIAELKSKVKNIVLECDHRLVSIFNRSFSDIPAYGWSDPPLPELQSPDIKHQIRMGDLISEYRRSFSRFPVRDGYLKANAEIAQSVRRYLKGDSDDLLVGISWRSTSLSGGTDKSIPLSRWSKILQVPNIKFVNLQYGEPEHEIQAISKKLGKRIEILKNIDCTNDIDGMVAAVSGLDLVITVSNVTAHYAGAVGTPVWVLLSPNHLWHWFLDRQDSPWYPSARLFRSKSYEEWMSIEHRVEDALMKFSSD